MCGWNMEQCEEAKHSEFGLVVALYEMVFNLVLNGLVSRDTHPNTHTTIHNITC